LSCIRVVSLVAVLGAAVLVAPLSAAAATYAPQTTLAFSGLRNPIDVAVDPVGDVFVADTQNARVVELPKGGSQTTLAFTGLSYPQWVALDAAGDVFVADTGKGQVLELTNGG